MASLNVNVTSGAWVEIPTELSLLIKHRKGGAVVYALADSEPVGFSDSVPIVAASNIGQTVTLGGHGLSVWAYGLTGDALLSYAEIANSSAAVVSYDVLGGAGMQTYGMTMAELYTALGKRYAHKFDLTFTGNESKYFLYETPSFGADFILAIQERNFRAKDGEAELEVLIGSTGYTALTPVGNIQRESLVSGGASQMSIYNLTDGSGNADPTVDGNVIDTDFVASTGSGGNRSGGFSPDLGLKMYPAGSVIALKVTNLENSSNRISLSYSWFELPGDYVTDV